MITKIYYFSGTGNTLYLAREIAKKIKVELVSIPKIMKEEKIHISAKRIGIIFPSYMAPVSGLPLIVERFVRKIDNIEKLTVFAVCNCGGYESVNALPSLHKLRQIINSCGGKLHAEYSLRLPMNNLDYDHIPIPINRDTGDIICKSKARIDYICSRLIENKGTKYKLVKSIFLILMKPMYKLIWSSVIKALKEKAHELPDSALEYFELIPLTDKSICVDDKCTGCGTCATICPVKNIKIIDKKPEFLHSCEMCFACDEWCPKSAIHHWSRAMGVKYHHPEVKLRDMLNR